MSLSEKNCHEHQAISHGSAASLPTASKSCSLPLPTRIAFVGNYLPRQCGIATFTTDLCSALATEFGAERLFAIPVNDPDSSYEYPEQVRLELEQEDLSSYERAAEFLNFNGNDLVCLQHEYGIYGGIAGSHILTLLRKLKMPVVTTLHTVLREPDANQRMVLKEIAHLSDRLVVMEFRMRRSTSFRMACLIFNSWIRITTRTGSALKESRCCLRSACCHPTRGSRTLFELCRRFWRSIRTWFISSPV
jgi:hypothetical protein